MWHGRGTATREADGSGWREVHEPRSGNGAEVESTKKVPLPISATQRTQLINEGAGAVLARRSGLPVKSGM